jgi:pimeloyl-ACP methyl ester carboxylesterase
VATPVAILTALVTIAPAFSAIPQWHDFRYSDSTSIRYFKAGHGSGAVLLLHGLAASSASWIDMVRELDCHCTIYALDLKGHGGSSKPDDHKYRLADNAAIVRAFIEANELKNVTIVGHSYGGAVALTVALMDREASRRVGALVLIGTPATKQRFPLTMTMLRYQKPARFFEKFTPPELSAWVALNKVYYDPHSITPARIALYANLWRDPSSTRAMRETGAEFLKGGLKR